MDMEALVTETIGLFGDVPITNGDSSIHLSDLVTSEDIPAIADVTIRLLNNMNIDYSVFNVKNNDCLSLDRFNCITKLK